MRVSTKLTIPRYSEERKNKKNIRSFPNRSSFKIPLPPCHATSAIQIPRTRIPKPPSTSTKSSHNGSYSSLTKPLACEARMVTSPGCGCGLFLGMYCLKHRWRISSCELAVARGYSRMCWASMVCSFMWNTEEEDIFFFFLSFFLDFGELLTLSRLVYDIGRCAGKYMIEQDMSLGL